jgi:hypothetical protein
MAGRPTPEAANAPQPSEVPRLSSPLPSPGSRTSPFRHQPGQNEPAPEGPGSRPDSDSSSSTHWSSVSGPGSSSGTDSGSSSDSAPPAEADRVPPPEPVPVKPQ